MKPRMRSHTDPQEPKTATGDAGGHPQLAQAADEARLADLLRLLPPAPRRAVQATQEIPGHAH